ncbi:MAG: RNA polymerase sigma factor [Cyclobacteriaceae bacterium]|nr:RNA polymerase sigma factor [Cyclobacteriaceae bacterium HetDA_MAG_MS6]
MLKVKAGDLEKLGLLYKRYSKRLFGFFYKMTDDPGTSEDLVQNVFMRMMKYRHTYSSGGKFETWAFHMARNVHHDHFRKNKRYDFQPTMGEWNEQLQDHDHEEHQMIMSDELANLNKAMMAMPSEKRELLELTRFQQLKYQDVAKLLGISEGAVKVRVHRALQELKSTYLKMDVS